MMMLASRSCRLLVAKPQPFRLVHKAPVEGVVQGDDHPGAQQVLQQIKDCGERFAQNLPIGKAVIKPDSKGLEAADGDNDEAPKDEEMAPTGRLPDYSLLAQDKGDHAPEAPAQLVEAVLRLPQQQDAVEFFDGDPKKVEGRNKDE